MAKPSYIRLTPEQREAFRASLAPLINDWLNAESTQPLFEACEFGYISEDLEELMADAAVSVLVAQNHIQTMLHEDGLLEPDEGLDITPSSN